MQTKENEKTEDVQENGQPEKVSKEEHAMVLALKIELDQMKKRKGILQKDLALITADIYRKADELEAKCMELTPKYNLQPGERELHIRTGEIIDPKKFRR